jgi:hypothetical protein
VRVEVERDRAAAAGLRHGDEAHAEPVEDARGSGIRRRRQRGLNAAFENEHAPRVRCRRPRTGRAYPRRNLALQSARQQRAHDPSELEQRPE